MSFATTLPPPVVAAVPARRSLTPRVLMRFFSVLLLAFMLLGLSLDAEARRMGGGKSAGRQSSNVTQREAARTPAAAPGQQQANAGRQQGQAGAANAGRSKPWAGILGGLAAGLGLAWLANALGLGEGFANLLTILLLGMAALFVFNLLRRGRTAAAPAGTGMGGMAYQGAGANAPVTPPQYNPTKVGNDASARPWEGSAAQFNPQPAGHAGAAAGGSLIGSALSGPQTWGIPADFDVAGFTDAAKRNFITLQAAWDKGDIPALRAMMTDEMLAEIQAQLLERERQAPGQPSQTDVVMLEAQLLGIEELPDAYMASVEFSGMIREDNAAGPTPFREVWNMTKPRQGRGGWLVAGLQALQ